MTTHRCMDCGNYAESSNGLACFCFYWLTFDIRPDMSCKKFSPNTRGHIAGHLPPEVTR